MPLYTYQCGDCRKREQRIAGADDHTALCVACGGLMLRLDVDVFGPYFEGRTAGGDTRVTRELHLQAVPPPGCDGLCRIDCEACDPQGAYCRELGEWPETTLWDERP